MRPSYRSVPDNPTGAPLNPCREWVGIIVPEATTNLLLNPSWELNTSNWTDSSTGSGGTPYARSTAAQCKGAYAAILTVRPTNGTYVQIVAAAVTVSTLYTISFHVKRPGKNKIKSSDVRAFVNNAAVEFDTIRYIGDGWYRCIKTFQATVTNAPGIRVLGSPGAIFYVDAAQLEAKGYETTYCDGDQVGLLPVEVYPPFIWNGTPHASTSTRSALTRAGGREMNLKRYGFTLIALMGLAMASRAVIATPLGLLDGSLYQRSIRESRSVTLAGAFEASSPLRLSQQRAGLYRALQHDLTGVDQPVVLTVQRYDGSDPIGAQGLIVAGYMSGLEGSEETTYNEKSALQLQQFLPMIVGSTSIGGTVSAQQSVTSVNSIIQKSPSGVWSTLGTGITGPPLVVNVMAYGPDGSLYVGGNFTTAGGVATNDIAKWNGSAWSALVSGTDGSVTSMRVAADGSLYIGGTFTTVGGVAAANIARWNGSAWSALGTGTNGVVEAIEIAPDGSLYAGGGFTLAGGVANTVRIAKWDGSAWSALGTGMNSTVSALAISPGGTLYAGGNFTTAGGGAANAIASWDGSAWAALGAGCNGAVQALGIDPSGLLYAGGAFTTAGGVTVNYAAVWNGIAWSALGTGLGAAAYDINVINSQLIYFSGTFTTAGGLTLPDSVAQWNGTAWAPVPVDLPGTATVRAVARSVDGTLVFGFDTAGTATAPGQATITNIGQAAGITFSITGPTSGAADRIYALINNTTGDAIYFDVSLVVGETATLTINNGTMTFSTNFRGNLPSAITNASSPTFRIVNGANVISFLTADSTMTATYFIIPQYDGLDGLTGR